MQQPLSQTHYNRCGHESDMKKYLYHNYHDTNDDDSPTSPVKPKLSRSSLLASSSTSSQQRSFSLRSPVVAAKEGVAALAATPALLTNSLRTPLSSAKSGVAAIVATPTRIKDSASALLNNLRVPDLLNGNAAMGSGMFSTDSCTDDATEWLTEDDHDASTKALSNLQSRVDRLLNAASQRESQLDKKASGALSLARARYAADSPTFGVVCAMRKYRSFSMQREWIVANIVQPAKHLQTQVHDELPQALEYSRTGLPYTIDINLATYEKEANALERRLQSWGGAPDECNWSDQRLLTDLQDIIQRDGEEKFRTETQ